MPDNYHDLEPSPAELGDTMTLAPGEWEPLDDIGTQIYVYGDQPVDVAVQRAGADDEVRQLHAEINRLHAALDQIRILHTDSPAGFCPSCYRATDVSDTDDGLVAYPCPTLVAIQCVVDLAALATRPYVSGSEADRG